MPSMAMDVKRLIEDNSLEAVLYQISNHLELFPELRTGKYRVVEVDNRSTNGELTFVQIVGDTVKVKMESEDEHVVITKDSLITTWMSPKRKAYVEALQ